MDSKKDTDFIIELDRKVTSGFSLNEEEHRTLMELQTAQEKRFEQVERSIQALQQLLLANQESNILLKELLLGSPDGKRIGCQEIQRDHAAFLRGIRRGSWVIATAVTAAAIAWIVQVVNYVSGG